MEFKYGRFLYGVFTNQIGDMVGVLLGLQK